MSDYVVVLAPAAERDIHDAFLWYRARSALAADAFRAEVFGTIDRMAEAPLTHPADGEGNRKRVLRRFPYALIYEVLGNSITLLAVAHHRRRPGYWRGDGG